MTALTRTAALTRPPLPRLTAVELRKMIDTRAGFWLLVAVGLSAVAMVVGVLAAGHADQQTMEGLLHACLWAVSILLPIVGLLAVTGEWSQRTALTTFTLVPERGRVVTAKLLAGCTLALAAVLVSLIAATAGNAIAGGSWSFSMSQLADGVLYELIGMIGALAIGLMLMHSALAVVAYFLVPMTVGSLAVIFPSLSDPAEWFGLNQSMESLVAHTTAGSDWAKLGVGAAIWIGVPIVIGLLRLRRQELS